MANQTSTIQTLGDLFTELGGVSLDRIRFHPPPGTAKEQDVIEIESRENRLCELVDGVLVEKAMGFIESILAVVISTRLREFVVPRNLGHVAGADGMLRLCAGLVRIPDVAYVAWDRFPNRRLPDDPIPELAPNLAVEVLSRTNTPEEMSRKRREYFEAGVQLVWIVDPRQRTVTVFSSVTESAVLSEKDVLDGGQALPGWTLAVQDLFAELDRRADG